MTKNLKDTDEKLKQQTNSTERQNAPQSNQDKEPDLKKVLVVERLDL